MSLLWYEWKSVACTRTSPWRQIDSNKLSMVVIGDDVDIHNESKNDLFIYFWVLKFMIGLVSRI